MFNKTHFDFFSKYGGKIKDGKNKKQAENDFEPLKKEILELREAIDNKLPSGYKLIKNIIKSTEQPKGRIPKGTKAPVEYVQYIWFKIYTDKGGVPNKEGKPQNVFNVTFNSSGISIKMNAFKNITSFVPAAYVENPQTITFAGKTHNDISNDIIQYCKDNADIYANNATLFSIVKPANKKAKQSQQNESGEKTGSSNVSNNASQSLNLILYGPPGTGKTYNAVNKALEIILGKDDYDILKKKADKAKTQATNHKEADKAYRKVFTDKFNELKNDGRIVFTTFHQSMSYEDFIEGIKPVTYTDSTTNQKTVTYPIKNGIFKQFCYDIIKKYLVKRNIIAEKGKDEKKIKENIRKVVTNNTFGDNNKETLDKYVLIIDEINRGNVSQIFGELITLIEDDKRLGEPEAKAYTVKLPYSNEEFSVPKNLYIIGTMNTADRSVEALDTALRRRFSFEEMMPNDKADGMDTNIEGHTLEEILRTINERIEVLKGREQQIGHSYLMKCETPADVKAAFKDKILPLLQEYFYGDYSQIALVLGPDFVKKINKVNFPSINGIYGPEQNETRYRMLKDTEWKELDLKEALDHLLNKQNQKEQQQDDQTDENS